MDFFFEKNDYSLWKYQNLVHIYKIKNSGLRNITIKLPRMYLLIVREISLHVILQKNLDILKPHTYIKKECILLYNKI